MSKIHSILFFTHTHYYNFYITNFTTMAAHVLTTTIKNILKCGLTVNH